MMRDWRAWATRSLLLVKSVRMWVSQVVGDDGDVVIGTQRTEEVVGGVLHVVDEVVAVGGELEQHDGGDGGLGDADAGDGLGDAVFEDEEVVGFEAGDELVGLVEDDVGVDVDDGDVDAEGVGVVVGVLDFGFGGGGGGGGAARRLPSFS